jgi:hypothetical protein
MQSELPPERYEDYESVHPVYLRLVKQGLRAWMTNHHDKPLKIVDGVKIFREYKIGDILCWLPERGLGRVEVKCDENPKFDFMKFSDWNTSEIFIDSNNHIHHTKYRFPLIAYAIVNCSHTCMFWIPWYFREGRWYSCRITNTRDDHPQHVIAMSKDCLRRDMFFVFDENNKIPQAYLSLDSKFKRPTWND